ncbi:hypothetical protein FKM82_001606 [Ascaphus truei]
MDPTSINIEEINTLINELEIKQASMEEKSTEKDYTNSELYYLIMNVADVDWKPLMRILELSDDEIKGCEENESDRREQKYKMLTLWIKNAGTLGKTKIIPSLIHGLNSMHLTSIANSLKTRCYLTNSF